MIVRYLDQIYIDPPFEREYFQIENLPVHYKSVGIVPDELENGMCVKFMNGDEWEETIVDWMNPYEIVERTENGFTMHGPRMLFHPQKFDFNELKQKGKVIICDNESIFV